MNPVIGREEETKLLQRLWSSKQAEFIAVYGRRRVGKTHLIRYLFNQKDRYMEVTGLKDGSTSQQLTNFAASLSLVFFGCAPIQIPKNWQQAFAMLTEQLKKLPKQKKLTLFLDELPWLATKRSGLLQQLDYYWNTTWSQYPNFKLIACGSAASWMLDNLINAKGGLYNRLTYSMLLRPFNLRSAQLLLESRKVRLSTKQLLDIYMVTGGIPHYLNQVARGQSAVQTINQLCFREDGLLYDEFPRLFKALFDQYDTNLLIIEKISQYRYGISREQLLSELKLSSGGTFNKRIAELEAAGFIKTFIPYGKAIKNHYYRTVDEYTQFYLKWIKPFSKTLRAQKNYWQTQFQTAGFSSWAGFTFETICYQHLDEIIQQLGLVHIGCQASSWRYQAKNKSDEQGAQIDLLLDRDDGVITLCEMKYSKNLFSIDKTCAMNLIKKIDIFKKATGTKKQIDLVLITTEGLKDNAWSEELIDKVVTLEHLAQ